MIDFSSLANKIADAKTRPERATAENEVLNAVARDAEETLSQARAANTFAAAVHVKDWADEAARKATILYDTVPVPYTERTPVRVDWDTRISTAIATYREAQRIAAEKTDAMAPPPGKPTPTPGTGDKAETTEQGGEATSDLKGAAVVAAIALFVPHPFIRFLLLALAALLALAGGSTAVRRIAENLKTILPRPEFLLAAAALILVAAKK